MATKRSAHHVHPSRQDQVPEEPRRKRQKPDNAGPKSFKKAHPVNELKGQIRSLKRLLDRNEGLAATIRVEKERALQTAQHELQQAERAKKRSEMIGKYHKIRFFDRQKATKRLKHARKALQACEGDDVERARLGRVVQDAEVDVNYAQYFPLDQPYVSMFPRKNEGEDEDASEEQGSSERKGDDVMWQRVRECMADGTLDALRNGKLQEEVPEPEDRPPTKSEKRKSSKSQEYNGAALTTGRKIDAGNDEAYLKDEGNDSDGGFFE